jgi:hypothetical protein
MSKKSEELALQLGHETAMTTLTAQKDKIAALSAEDRLHWWIGFVTAAMGAARASVGEPAFRALRRSLTDEVELQEAVIDSLRKAYATGGLDLQKTGTYTAGVFGRTKKKA